MAHGAAAVAHIPPGFVVGAKAVRRVASSGKPVKRLIVAADAPDTATEPVRRLAAERAWPLIEVASSVVLGLFCGVGRPVAAAAELAVTRSGT